MLSPSCSDAPRPARLKIVYPGGFVQRFDMPATVDDAVQCTLDGLHDIAGSGEKTPGSEETLADRWRGMLNALATQVGANESTPVAIVEADAADTAASPPQKLFFFQRGEREKDKMPIFSKDSIRLRKASGDEVSDGWLTEFSEPGDALVVYVHHAEPSVDQYLKHPEADEAPPAVTLVKAIRGPLLGKQHLAYTELIDNADESTIHQAGRHIILTLDFEARQIEVYDNGRGATKDQLREMAMAGQHAAKGRGGQPIGHYGIGYNSSTASISDKSVAESRVVGHENVWSVSLDVQAILKSGKWGCEVDHRMALSIEPTTTCLRPNAPAPPAGRSAIEPLQAFECYCEHTAVTVNRAAERRRREELLLASDHA